MTEVSCKTGLKKNIINKEVFDREIAICQDDMHKKGRCCWGKCENCGVIPLLYKLHKGKLIDDKDELVELKGKILNHKVKK